MVTNNAINTGKPIEVANGGTGATTLTDHGVLVGSGTAAIDALVVGTTGQLLVGATGADPAFGSSALADFTFTSATAGATRTLTVSSTDNSASTTALIQTTVGGASAGDPIHTFTVTGASSGSIGLDNSDSDRMKLSYSTALGTTDTVIMDATGGQYKGYGTNTAPAAGFIGEQIRATVSQASAVTLSTGTPANVTSISLTAGIWDVSCLCAFTGITTGTAIRGSISTTSATEGTEGDNRAIAPLYTGALSNQDWTLAVPSYRISLSATTTVYMVANAVFTVGTGKAYGRISATRVG